jgi:hypothetical protein
VEVTALRFVKGHCGWDTVTLLPEGQIEAEAELPASIKILALPMSGGLEVGWLGAGERDNEIRVRMVNSTTRNWIPMCGGMTQVIGKALVETFLRDHFHIVPTGARLDLTLQTPSGAIAVGVDLDDGRVSSVTTVMDAYAAFAYRKGVEDCVLEGVPVLRVGTYAVIDIDALSKRHPGVDFTSRQPGAALEIVHGILRAFRTRLGLSGVNGMLYDSHPEGRGEFRVFPRFYSDDLAAARIPWEFQCGTGSIVVAIALAEAGRLPFDGEECETLFEWGSRRTTPDPYGVRTSKLHIRRQGSRVTQASFSHSVIEILAQGTLRLPEY